MRLGIGAAFPEGMEHAHEDFPRFGTRLRLRPEAHLPGDDRGAQFTLAAIVVSGLPLAIAELRLQALVLFEERIDLPLFLPTARAEGATHGPSGASPAVALAGAVPRRC